MSAQDVLSALADDLDQRLAAADADLAASFPGDRGVRQPVHTVYVPGDRYTADTIAQWGAGARDVLGEHGRSVMELAEALELRPSLAVEVYDRVRAKLEREPIEDLRIDFEDGYGDRPDDQEDAAVISAARALAASVEGGQRFAVPRDPDQVASRRRRVVAGCARSTSSSASWPLPTRSPTAS